jgi:hypothetical protein
MKTIKPAIAAALSLVLLGASFSTSAADKKSDVKPYKLEKCIISDEKLGEMGKPVVFEYKGQEIKLCCKSCKKDFDKDPAKYLKKLETEEKKAAEAKPKADK